MKKLIIILMSLVVLFFYCSKSEEQKADNKTSNPQTDNHELETEEGTNHDHLHISEEVLLRIGLKTAYPEVKNYVKKGKLTGIVKENKGSSHHIHSLLDGYVKFLVKDIGEEVIKGDTLCLINSPELLTIKEAYVKAFMNYSKEQINYNNAKVLYSQNAIKQREFLNRETNYKSGLSEFYAIEGKLAAIGILEKTLSPVKKALKTGQKGIIKEFLSPYFNLRSPITGIVLHQDLILGEHVGPEKLLYKVSDLKNIWVDFQAKERDLPFIKIGQEIIIMRDIRGLEKFIGKIRNIAQAIDLNIRTVKVRIEVNNEGLMLKPGMFVWGYYNSSDPKEELAVPQDAVVKINGAPGVFLKETDGFKFEPIEILTADFNNYVFVRGLALDSEVVVNGAFYLKAQQELSTGGTDPHAGHSH